MRQIHNDPNKAMSSSNMLASTNEVEARTGDKSVDKLSVIHWPFVVV